MAANLRRLSITTVRLLRRLLSRRDSGYSSQSGRSGSQSEPEEAGSFSRSASQSEEAAPAAAADQSEEAAEDQPDWERRRRASLQYAVYLEMMKNGVPAIEESPECEGPSAHNEADETDGGDDESADSAEEGDEESEEDDSEKDYDADEDSEDEEDDEDEEEAEALAEASRRYCSERREEWEILTDNRVHDNRNLLDYLY